MYNPSYRHSKSAEPTYLVGAANAVYLYIDSESNATTLQELRASLAVGAIGIVTDTGLLVTTATNAAAVARSNSFQIYYRTADGVLRKTPMISRGAWHSGAVAAVAGVLRNQVIGGSAVENLNLPATLSVGDTAEIIISNTTNPHQSGNGDVQVYIETANAADTVNTLLTRLIAKINADPTRIVNAAAIADGSDVGGIRLTAINISTIFMAGADGVIINAQRHWDGTTESSNTGRRGNGLYSQLKEVEADAEITMGRSFVGVRDSVQWWGVPSVIDTMIPTQVDTATGLTTYQFLSSSSGNMGAAQRTEGTQMNVTVAFVPGSAVLTSFNTMMGVLMLTPSDQVIGS